MLRLSFKMLCMGVLALVLGACSLFGESREGTPSPNGEGRSPQPTVASSPQPAITASPSPSTAASPKPTASATVAPTKTPAVAATPKQTALEFADQVVAALQARDMAKLATLADPVAGVQFSPYAYIEVKKAVVLTAEQLTNALFDSNQTYVWGSFDGSGMEMKLTFADYFQKFVYDKDYVKLGKKAENKLLQTGNTQDNIKEAYPKASFVEYNVPGTDANMGMDWSSLRIILIPDGNSWRLVGIVHDGWTI